MFLEELSGCMVNTLFGGKIFNPFPSFTSFSLPSIGGIGGKSADSSPPFVSHFYNRFILNFNGLPDSKVGLFTEMKMVL